MQARPMNWARKIHQWCWRKTYCCHLTYRDGYTCPSIPYARCCGHVCHALPNTSLVVSWAYSVIAKGINDILRRGSVWGRRRGRKWGQIRAETKRKEDMAPTPLLRNSRQDAVTGVIPIHGAKRVILVHLEGFQLLPHLLVYVWWCSFFIRIADRIMMTQCHYKER